MITSTTHPVVAAIDDDADFLAVLKAHFKKAKLSFSTFSSAAAFLDSEPMFQPHPYGCLFVDYRMPEMTGLQFIEELGERRWSIPTILFTAHADISVAVQAMREGAFDVLEKPSTQGEIVDRARSALEFFQKIRQVADERRAAVVRVRYLTPREDEVLSLMAKGATNREIADQLGISNKTLDIHRANLMEKLDARTVADLVKAHLLVNTENLCCLPKIYRG